jgi:hypothetical protein
MLTVPPCIALFDEPDTDRFLTNRRQLTLSIALASIGHLLLIALLPTETLERVTPTTLSVTLRMEPEPVKEMLREPVPQQPTAYSQPEPTIPSSEITDTIVKPKSRRAVDYHTIEQTVNRTSALSDNSPNLEATKPKTFSTADFPQHNNTEQPVYERVSILPRLISQPSHAEFKSPEGYYTIKSTDRHGNVTCMQERGFKGNGNPNLWYRVPASMCNHVK